MRQNAPDEIAKKAAGKRYDELLTRRPDLRPCALAMIDEGKTLAQIVDALDGNAEWKRVVARVNAKIGGQSTSSISNDVKAGWDKAVAKVNARFDAVANGRAE